MKNFINSFNIFRILIAPIIFLLITNGNNYSIALFLFVLAALSDFWDGYLARKYNFETVIGEILDPIADKILLVFMLLAFIVYFNSIYIGFIGGIILAREFWISALRDFNSKNNISVTKVTFLAKIKTTVQFSTFFLYLVGIIFDNGLIILISNLLLLIALIITLQTGIKYTVNTINFMNNKT